jgi:hypothetical protein
MDVLTLASLLGATKVQMIMRYVHLTDQHKREAAEKLEATAASCCNGPWYAYFLEKPILDYRAQTPS